ncbi:protein KTI12 homolog isoform X1 [Lingula anatina]|uniref:Protein KTI12 homolog n=1 Tax=Lingula anatina TaxID=7574 RepID=A0A1S3HJ49_LINAN|nr:protein KTI12 homolog isoform X1 [Lingula anatina]|eukprot:XP_013385019.1 protein KTI12 homolog isoform X1 [Lingula anatina]
MPLVVMCGLPCSGKTTRTNQLKHYLESELSKAVHIIDDHAIGIYKNEIYAESKSEKDARSALKSAVQRKLSREDVLILDSLNYIKGYRYELFCLTKASQTPHAVIHCEIDPHQAAEWNKNRSEEDSYSQEILDALVMRFETPDSRSRWDSPLFTIHPTDELPYKEISDSLFQRKPPPPNLATVAQPLSSTNFLYELDRITQDVINVILDAQKTSVPGDKVAIPNAQEKVELFKHVTLAELQRTRRQFISYTKMHPMEDTSKIGNMFVQYLNKSIR